MYLGSLVAAQNNDFFFRTSFRFVLLSYLATSTTACWLGLSLLPKLQISSESILGLLTLAGQLHKQCTCKANYQDTLWLLAATAKN